MIFIEDILQLHTASIVKYGGSHGIRDEGLLQSAIGRPYKTFDEEDLYPSVFEKAAALMESIIINHPFVDGNKRTGFLAMFLLMKESNLKIKASEDEAYNFTINISTGTIKFEQIVIWLEENTNTF